MKLIVGYPPNYGKIQERFNPPTGTVFTYGDMVYCPNGANLSPDILAHEAVHIKQQEKIRPDFWWEYYLKSAEFRLQQETPAYQAQYKKFCELKKDRNIRAKFLHVIASYLSGEVYGNLISYAQAVEKIKNV